MAEMDQPGRIQSEIELLRQHGQWQQQMAMWMCQNLEEMQRAGVPSKDLIPTMYRALIMSLGARCLFNAAEILDHSTPNDKPSQTR